MANELKYILDTNRVSYSIQKCKQNDDRTIIVSLFSNGVAWIPDVGSVLELRGKRANNTISIQTATDISIIDNIVTIALDRDFTRVPGNVDLELAIRGIDIDLTTFTFGLSVLTSVLQDGLEVSNNTSNILEALTTVTDWSSMYLNNPVDNVVRLTKKHGQYSIGIRGNIRIITPLVMVGEYVNIDYMLYADADVSLIFEDDIKFSNLPVIQAGRSYRFSFWQVNGFWHCEWVKLERYFKDYIYKSGDTCDVLTGGYIKSNYDSRSTVKNEGVKLSIYAVGGYCQASTVKSIDLTNHSKLYVDFDFLGTENSFIITIGTTAVYSSGVTSTISRKIIAIDISAINNIEQIKFKAFGSTSKTATLNIYNAWLEKNEFADTSQEIFTTSEKTKLSSISANANKVLDSTINGNILIDGVETNIYYIQSGTTANRPIPILIGQAYFDTTLGKQINAKTLNPLVWVDGIGTVV